MLNVLGKKMLGASVIGVLIWIASFVSPESVLPFLPNSENAECTAGACSMSAYLFRKCSHFQNIYVVLKKRELHYNHHIPGEWGATCIFLQNVYVIKTLVQTVL
jgi:hypothetical protein